MNKCFKHFRSSPLPIPESTIAWSVSQVPCMTIRQHCFDAISIVYVRSKVMPAFQQDTFCNFDHSLFSYHSFFLLIIYKIVLCLP